MFVDIAKVHIKAGNGGNGVYLFTEKNMWLPAVPTAATAEKVEMLL